MRTTFANAKASRIPEALNVSSTDARFAQYINEATLRLMQRGKWWGTFGRYAISVDSNILTCPAVIETLEKVNIEKAPMPIRSQWFEFLQFGWGTRDETLPNGSGILEVLYRGTSPTFKSISAASILTAKCDVLEDVAKEVRILGEDANGNFVRTQPGGPGTAWEDGEVVELAQGAGTPTTTVFSKVTDIQPATDLEGRWWLYEGTVAGGTLIGQYEYWETAPAYKQYLIPFSNSTITTVEAMAKLAFRPVANDTDYLLIGNLSALKLACMAIKAEEEHSWQEANLLWNGGTLKNGQKVMGAIQELDAELGHHIGDGTQLGLTVNYGNSGYGEPVEPLV